MTFFDCTADLVGQLNGNGQKGMLQIVQNFWLRYCPQTGSSGPFWGTVCHPNDNTKYEDPSFSRSKESKERREQKGWVGVTVIVSTPSAVTSGTAHPSNFLFFNFHRNYASIFLPFSRWSGLHVNVARAHNNRWDNTETACQHCSLAQRIARHDESRTTCMGGPNRGLEAAVDLVCESGRRACSCLRCCACSLSRLLSAEASSAAPPLPPLSTQTHTH